MRRSKVSSDLVAYRWLQPPDLTVLAGGIADDHSGEMLAGLVRASHDRNGSGPQSAAAQDAAGAPVQLAGPDVEAFMREASPWSDVAGTLAAGRNNGVHKLAAALRGQGGWTLETALAHMHAEVWPLIDQVQGGHEFSVTEFETVIANVWRQYPDGGEQRITAAADTSPGSLPSGVGLTDAYMADRVAAQCLAGRFLWSKGLGWMAWDGKRWVRADVSVTHDAVRSYFIWLHSSAAAAGATTPCWRGSRSCSPGRGSARSPTCAAASRRCRRTRGVSTSTRTC